MSLFKPDLLWFGIGDFGLFFLLFHDVIDGFGHFCGLAWLGFCLFLGFGLLLFAERAVSEEGELYSVYDDETDRKDDDEPYRTLRLGG